MSWLAIELFPILGRGHIVECRISIMLEEFTADVIHLRKNFKEKENF